MFLGKPTISVCKRRDWFCRVAKANGLDPLVAEHWYSAPLESLHTPDVFFYIYFI